VVLKPWAYSGGEQPEDGGPGWQPFGPAGPLYPINPRLVVEPWAWDMLPLWRLYQGGGMGGAGHLPDAGGSLDQAAVMIEAFGLMTATERELSPDG